MAVRKYSRFRNVAVNLGLQRARRRSARAPPSPKPLKLLSDKTKTTDNEGQSPDKGPNSPPHHKTTGKYAKNYNSQRVFDSNPHFINENFKKTTESQRKTR